MQTYLTEKSAKYALSNKYEIRCFLPAHGTAANQYKDSNVKIVTIKIATYKVRVAVGQGNESKTLSINKSFKLRAV